MNNRKEMSQDEMMKALQKELRITRYCSLFVSVLLLLTIAGGIYTVNKMQPALEAVQNIRPTIQKIEDLDVKALNQKIEQLDIEVLNQKIEQLDIDGLNQIVEDLDVEELSETLKNINDAADKIREIQSGFSGVSDSFSDAFSGWFKGLY